MPRQNRDWTGWLPGTRRFAARHGRRHRRSRRLRARRRLIASLAQALHDGSLSMHYQPQFRLRDGRLVGAEALMRWTHPWRGLISPDLFIPLAEHHGLIHDLGRWALHDVCDSVRQWRADGLSEIRWAVNVSAFQLQRPGFERVLAGARLRAGAPAPAMEIELTETAAMTDLSVAEDNLNAVRRLGVGVAVDDFGTGHASLRYLQRLPLTRLKIDRGFVGRIDSDPRSAVIVDAVISLAAAMGLEVVAEGVERTLHLEFLRERGCQEAQGYLLARPMPMPALRRFALGLRSGCHPSYDDHASDTRASRF